MTPTLVVVNARIATGDPRRPWATGVAFEHDTLVLVASAAELLKVTTPSTRVVDAGGRTLRLPEGVTAGSTVRVTVGDGGDVTFTAGAVNPTRDE